MTNSNIKIESTATKVIRAINGELSSPIDHHISWGVGKNVRISIMTFRYCNRKSNKVMDYWSVKSAHNIEKGTLVSEVFLKIIQLALKDYDL